MKDDEDGKRLFLRNPCEGAVNRLRHKSAPREPPTSIDVPQFLQAHLCFAASHNRWKCLDRICRRPGFRFAALSMGSIALCTAARARELARSEGFEPPTF